MKISDDRVRWIFSAFIKGPSDDEIRALVRELLAARKMRDAMGGANDSGDGWFVSNEYVNSYDKAREGDSDEL